MDRTEVTDLLNFAATAVDPGGANTSVDALCAVIEYALATDLSLRDNTPAFVLRRAATAAMLEREEDSFDPEWVKEFAPDIFAAHA